MSSTEKLKYMKKLIITTVLSLGLFTNLTAFAESSSEVSIPSAPEIGRVNPVKEEREDYRENRKEKINNKASKMIEERVKSLNSNQEAIAKSKLTDEQKASLTAILATSSAKLSALKLTIGSTTDATTSRALIDSIIKDYRIYGIVIPQVRLESRIYQLKNHSIKLSETFLKVEAKIAESKAKGYDVSSWEKSVSDAKILVAGDMFKLDEIMKQAALLTPASYGTTSKALIEGINNDLKLVNKDFNKVRSMVVKPRWMKKVTNTATSTPTTSTTTTR